MHSNMAFQVILMLNSRFFTTRYRCNSNRRKYAVKQVSKRTPSMTETFTFVGSFETGLTPNKQNVQTDHINMSHCS